MKQEQEIAIGIIGLIVAASNSDGQHCEKETYRGAQLIMDRFDLTGLTTPFDERLSFLETNGLEQLIRDSCKRIPKDWAATAFAVYCEVLLSDRLFSNSEKGKLALLQSLLAVPDVEVMKIIDVLNTLHKGQLMQPLSL